MNATSRALTAPHTGLSNVTGTIVTAGSAILGAITLIALFRLAAGMTPATGYVRQAALMIHLATVVPAIPLGLAVLLGRKGTPRHRTMGKVWLTLMGVTAISTLFIRNVNDGSFSLIHLFVPLTFFGIYQIITSARRHDIAAHKRHVTSLYIGALLVAGFASFFPGRLMWHWLVS